MNKLYSNLYNQNTSRNNLEELLKSFNESEFIPFIGAGLSQPLGINSWEDILEELKDIANNRFSANLKIPGDSKEWPQLASDIFNLFKKNGSESEFYGKLCEQSEPRNCNFTSIHSKLINTFNIFLTTNFDVTIEKAFRYIKNKKPNIQCLPNFKLLDLINGSIVYLHSHKTKKIFIFKKEEYDSFYPSVSKKQPCSRNLESFLERLYREKIIIFLGFSFRDCHLKEYFTKLANQIKDEEKINRQLHNISNYENDKKKIKHFLIISEDTIRIINQQNKFKEIKEFCDKYESINLKTIIYKKQQHIFIEDLLDKLSTEKERKELAFLE